MAYALVGSIGTVATGTNSASPTFAQATTAGNLLICWFVSGSAGGAGSAPTGYSQGSVSTGSQAFIAYKANCGAGETAPTVGSAGTIFALLAEFSGGRTTSPLDQAGQGNVFATTPMVSTNGAVDATTGELFVSCFEWSLSKAGTCTTADTYNNATPAGNLSNDATSTIPHYRFAYGFTTTKASADSNSESNSSMNLSSGQACTCSFLLPSAIRVPRNSAINHQNPAVLMEGDMEQDKRNHLWLPRKKLWRPRIEIPTPHYA